MRILITGRGTSGSWRIRGVQLGAAIGADVEPRASSAVGYDVAVIVKRPDVLLIGAPIAWDVVDAWPQPIGSNWSRQECVTWLRQRVQMLRPQGIVAATRQMANDCEEFGVPVLPLPHHARPEQKCNPIRLDVKVVGYEGSERQLGTWGDFFRAECARRGWRFAINPESLADCDILVAARQETGYAARTWKSNVKLANAQATGTPIVLPRELGYVETQTGGEAWADTEEEFRVGFDRLTDQAERIAAQTLLMSNPPTLARVATQYRAWLSRLTH